MTTVIYCRRRYHIISYKYPARYRGPWSSKITHFKLSVSPAVYGANKTGGACPGFGKYDVDHIF